MHEMGDVGERKTKVLGGLSQNLFRCWMIAGKEPGLAAAGFAEFISNALIDGPTGTTLFHSRAIFIEANVADFRLAGSGAVKNLSINDQAAANAAAKGHIKNRITALP